MNANIRIKKTFKTFGWINEEAEEEEEEGVVAAAAAVAASAAPSLV